MSNKRLTASLIDGQTISVGARSSPLSRAQVEEVQAELLTHRLEPLWVETIGDSDQKTSLRTLQKTDFFTKEIDAMLFAETCRIAVHSAKDLPDPLPKGLAIAAVTQGVDSSDSLVFRSNESLETLPTGAKVATSSIRREECVQQLRPDLSFIDIRGTIGQRLQKLDSGEADGVVIAEAALIRLGLTHLNRIKLPGETVEGQGKLAILARESDEEMLCLFAPLDSRKRILYLGLNAPKDSLQEKFFHYPIIRTVPRQDPGIQKAFESLKHTTHLIFTSQTAVPLFFERVEEYGISKALLQTLTTIAVGTSTAKAIQEYGLQVSIIPKRETAEGIVAELGRQSLKDPFFFWPHSALSRPVLTDFFAENSYKYEAVVLYDTYPQRKGDLPANDSYDTIFFTSPSCIDAYLSFFGALPMDKELKAIGYITAKHLTMTICNLYNSR